MKWRNGKSSAEFLPEKTFLIIKDNLASLTTKQSKRWAKSKSAVDTGTWPPKVKKHCPYSDEERPKTANLEEPSVLDPSLVNKLDMSLLSKELLSDSMTRIQLGVRKLGGGTSSSNRHDVQQTISDRRSATLNVVETKASCTRQKRRSFDHLITIDQRTPNKETSSESITMRKQISPNPPNSTSSNDLIVRKRSLDLKKLDDNNNKNGTSTINITPGKPVSLSTVRMTKSSRPAISSEIEVFTNSTNKLAPEPCKTCGRHDQPERFHSHPKGVAPLKISNKDSNGNKFKDPEKKTVQKPVALNFRSEKNKVKDDKFDVTMEKSYSTASRPSSVKKGPRTVTCYICAREFGTASFPIHEPKCMEKWERENNALPLSQRRPIPQRPNVPVDDQEWNTVAWKQSQMQLVPCWKCGRTFLPDRLTVHEKSCKATPKQNSLSSEKSTKSKSASSRSSPPKIFCQICGRTFGTRSIKIHEPQCLKKWQNENDTFSNEKNRTSYTSSSPVRDFSYKPTTPCYICGRDFGSASIVIHEPQCLKKWQIENAKLPLNQQRTEPQKPEVILRETSSLSGNANVDWTATTEARWRSHLGQLIPCKHCKRTFNPDRVSIHERHCKGSR